MSRTLLTGALSLVLGGLLSCGGANDPGSRVTTLRVLAVAANQAGDTTGGDYAHPGETVNLTTLWYDPDDSKRGISMPVVSWQWIACVDPSDSSLVGCLAKFAQDYRAAGGDITKVMASIPGIGEDTWSLKVPDDAISRLPTAAQDRAMVGVIALTCPGELGFDVNANALAGQLPISCGVSVDKATGNVTPLAVSKGGTALPLDQWSVGLKRIFVRAKDRNKNPVITGILFDGNPWAPSTDPSTYKSVTTCDSTTNTYDQCSGSEHHDITVQVDPSSLEKGTDEYGQSFTEEVVVQFYATEGIFEHDVRLASKSDSNYVVRSGAKSLPGGNVHLWFVVRDNRGGVTWTDRWLHAQ